MNKFLDRNKRKINGCSLIIIVFVISMISIAECSDSYSRKKLEKARADSIQKIKEDSTKNTEAAEDVSQQFIKKQLNYGGDDNYELLLCNEIYPNIYLVHYHFTAQNGFGAYCKMFAGVIIHHNPKSKPEEGWELGSIEINDLSNNVGYKRKGTYDTDRKMDSIDRIDSIKTSKMKYAGE